MAWVRAFCCNSIYVLHRQSMKVPISCIQVTTRLIYEVWWTVGPQTTSDTWYLQQMGLGMWKLATPKKLYNANDTTNKAGNITHYVDLNVHTNNIHKEMRFLVSDIGWEDMILGHPLLAGFEPQFSWKQGVVGTDHLPIMLNSINPQLIQHTIATLQTEEWEDILQTLEQECMAWGASTQARYWSCDQ